MSPVTSWRDDLSKQQIDDGLEILQHFGFENLYNKDSMPNMDILKNIQKKKL